LAKILIIDDSKIMRLNLRKLLEKLGHKIIAEGTNTFECIKHLERSKDDIDIVILDIIMPRAQGYSDGIDAIKHIKKIDDSMPILVLTCDASQQTVLKAIKEGANEYLLKPISLKKLEQSIEYVESLSNDNEEIAVSKE
jgi:two-component system chemotaxis response regulator CheY